MESLLYMGVMVLVVLVLGGLLYFKHKYNVRSDELNLARLLIGVVKYTTSQLKFTNSELVEKILFYMIEAIDVVQEYENIDLEEKNNLIKEETLEICKLEGIVVDDNLVELIDGILDYLNLSGIMDEAVK